MRRGDGLLGVTFSCDGCGLKDERVLITARGKDQDVVAWMEQATVEVASAHRFLSPHCTATHLKDFKIPVDGATQIGGLPGET
jgi:hypothetical protein